MKRTIIYLIFLLTMGGCKEKYIPSITSPATGYLVVEGFINSGKEPTSITLTRTTGLIDSVNIIYEHNAQVNIEGKNLQTFPLVETGNGIYISSSLNLTDNQKYRVQIKTQDGKQYASDFVPFKRTPDIDSISWVRENRGLKIYINAHSPQNNIKYYKWKYEETWEFHSAFYSYLEYVTDPVTGLIAGVRLRPLQPDTTIYKCWQSVIPTQINLGTSEKLSSDIIYHPIVFIENGAEKLSVLYSIRVKQYALSKEAYLFFEKLKKNTEKLGSIFDPQPSELQGNIHCITNPAEVVIGFLDISEEKEKRIFISNSMLNGWNYNTHCAQVLIKVDKNYYGFGVPISALEYGPFGVILSYFASDANCVDCTLRGRNTRPSFWP